MYCHLRPPDAIAFPTYHLLGLQISAADEPNAVTSRVTVWLHVNAASRVCDGLGRNKIVRLGKKSGPVFSRLWTKVHEIFEQCRRVFILSDAFARLSMARFVQNIFAIKYRSRRKPNVKFLGPIIFLGDDSNCSIADC